MAINPNERATLLLDMDGKQAHKELAALDIQAKKLNKEMKELKSASTAFNRESSKLKKTEAQYKALDKEAERLQNQLKGITKGTDEYKRTAGDLKKVQTQKSRLRTTIIKTRAAMDSLSKKQDQFTKKSNDYNKITRKIDKLTKEIGYSSMSMNELQKAQRLLNASFNKSRPGTKEYKQYRKELQKVNQQMQKTSAGARGLSGAWQKMGGNLKTYAGIAGSAAIAGGLANIALSADDARVQVERLTALTGEELDKAAAKAQSIATTFGQSVPELTNAANAFAKRMGISFDESLDLIEKGFRRGADANGEFIQTLREYPTFFREAGLSAEESIAIMSQMPAEGLYSDKGVDAIKEATIRLREMTPVTRDAIDAIGISSSELEQQLRSGSITYFDAIQMVSTKLGELPEQSTEVGQALADIFGGAGEDAGVEFIKSLGTMETGINQIKETSLTAKEEIRSMFADLVTAVQPVMLAIIKAFTNFMAWVKKNANEIKIFGKIIVVATTALLSYKAASKLAGLSLEDFTKILKRVKKAFKGLNLTMKANLIGLITGLVAAAITTYALFKDEIGKTSQAQKIHNKVMDEANKKIENERAKLESLFAQLKMTNPESDKRKEIIDKLNGAYPDLISNYDLEKASLAEIDKIQKEVIANMEKRIRFEAVKDEYTEIIKSLRIAEKELKKFQDELAETESKIIKENKRAAVRARSREILELKDAMWELEAEMKKSMSDDDYDWNWVKIKKNKKDDNDANDNNNDNDVNDDNKRKIPIPDPEQFKADLYLQEQRKLNDQLISYRRDLTDKYMTEDERELIAVMEKYQAILSENQELQNRLGAQAEELQNKQGELTEQELEELKKIDMQIIAFKEQYYQTLEQMQDAYHDTVMEQLEERLQAEKEAQEKDIEDVRGMLPEDEASTYRERIAEVEQYYDEVKAMAADLTDKEKIEANRRKELANAETEEERQLINEHYDEMLAQVEANGDLEIEAEQAKAEAIKEINRERWADGIAKAQEYFSAVKDITGSLLEISANKAEKEIRDVKRENKVKQNTLKARLNQDLMSQRAYELQAQRLDEQAAQREADIKREQWSKQHQADLITATVQGILASAAALAQPPGPPATIPASIVAAAMGAAKVAAIASQPTPEFREGGIIQGPSHAAGGVAIVDGIGRKVAEAEGGEAFQIISKEDTRRMMNNIIPETLPQVNFNQIQHTREVVRMQTGGVVMPGTQNAYMGNTEKLLSLLIKEQQETRKAMKQQEVILYRNKLSDFDNKEVKIKNRATL